MKTLRMSRTDLPRKRIAPELADVMGFMSSDHGDVLEVFCFKTRTTIRIPKTQLEIVIGILSAARHPTN